MHAINAIEAHQDQASLIITERGSVVRSRRELRGAPSYARPIGYGPVLTGVVGGWAPCRQPVADAFPGLPDLPNDVLDSIFSLMHFRDRVRLLSTCQELHRVSATSLSLWADVALHLPTSCATLQFAASLAALRPPPLRRLQLTQGAICGDDTAAEAVATQQATNALATALGGLRTLEALAWTVPADPCAALAGWAAAGLPALHSLSLTCQGPLTLPPELGRLPRLEQLRLYEAAQDEPDMLAPAEGSRLALTPGCLPVGLLQLEIQACGLPSLPAAVAQATRLTALRLGNGGEPLSLRGLGALRALRVLALPEAWPSEALLEELGQLPELALLDLSCPPGEAGAERGWAGGPLLLQPRAPAVAEERLARLAVALPGLRELRLGGWGMRCLPRDVLAMPHLQALHLEGSPSLVLDPLPPEDAPDCQLDTLTLDASAALASLPALRHLRCLASLCLSNVTSSGVPWRQSAVGRVWAALGGAGAATALRHVWAGRGPSE